MVNFVFEITNVENFAFAVKVQDADIHELEGWCERALGQKLSSHYRIGKWFQSRGVFFFNTRFDLDRFILSAKVLHDTRVMKDHNPVFFKDMAQRIYSSFS